MSLFMERFQSGINWELFQNRVKIVGFAVGFIAIGVWGDGIYNGTAKLPWLHQQAAVLHKVETVDFPALKSADGCEKWRAERLKKLALQTTVVDPSQVPPPCPIAKVK